MKLLREYIRTILEANEYGWKVSSKKNMLLDKEGMTQSDKDNQEAYLKSMSLMEGLLTEAAKGPEDLPDDVVVVRKSDGNTISIYYGKADDPSDDEVRPFGSIDIGLANEKNWGPCGNTWMVLMSMASEGWGPLLYDVAMEHATMTGGGMISDRGDVSPDARKVWDYYLGKRGEVESHQLDDLENTLTPDIEEDNCDQAVAGEQASPTGPRAWRVRQGGDWVKSPLSKRYTKSPSTINQLDAMGKLVEL